MIVTNKKVVFKILITILIVSIVAVIGFVSKNALFNGIPIENSIEVNKGFEDIESIEISEVYYEDGETKVKRKSVIEDTISIKNIITPFNKKVELLNQSYCAIIYNKMTVNKKDWKKEDYDLLIGDEYIIIYNGSLTYRIEDKEAAIEFTKAINENIDKDNK